VRPVKRRWEDPPQTGGPPEVFLRKNVGWPLPGKETQSDKRTA
jgi:hypothetical protein